MTMTREELENRVAEQDSMLCAVIDALAGVVKDIEAYRNEHGHGLTVANFQPEEPVTASEPPVKAVSEPPVKSAPSPEAAVPPGPPASSGPPKAAKSANGTLVTLDTVRATLADLATRLPPDKANEVLTALLTAAADVQKVSQVPPERYAAVLDAVAEYEANP